MPTTQFEAAAEKRSLTREAMIKLLLLEVASEPYLIDNILGRGLSMTGEAKARPSDVPRLINRETLPLLWEADHVGQKGSCRPLARLTGCRGCADPASPAGIGRAPSTEWADRLAQAELEEASGGSASGPTIAR